MESLRKPEMIQAMAMSTECLQKLEYSMATTMYPSLYPSVRNRAASELQQTPCYSKQRDGTLLLLHTTCKFLLFWYTKQASKKIDEMSAVATPALNDTLPKGDRKKRNSQDSDDSADGNEVATLADKATGKTVSTTKDDDGKKESLNIKIHLDLKVKVKLELDAEIYGDVVIGLL
ncbi:hypothetical protein DTO166G4_3908 [Paecilomyces variotii]|nr:hypothetical protein DTO166G4_3908 [Paecilomyces variotii]KAJ9238256.1 hypothetical protein DTO166G5_3158 [Paecilomyces variotii]